MLLLTVLILALCSLTSISGSRNKNILINSSSATKAAAIHDSSNSDTTSSEDSDSWDFSPKVNEAKTRRDFKLFIEMRNRNLELSRKWDMEANIRAKEEPLWDLEKENNDGKSYYPLDIDPSELEDQVNPKRSVISRIMAQYRKDMGFNPVGNIFDSEPEFEEVSSFFRCFESRPKKVDQKREKRISRRSEKRIKKLGSVEEKETVEIKEQLKIERKAERKQEKRLRKSQKLAEAYSFLKFLGKIPQFTALTLKQMTCEEIRAHSGDFEFRYYQDIREAYKTELKYYNLLNWDYLDLTHFEFHYFPILDQITRNISYAGNAKVISPPVLTSKGLNILTRYEKHIRFHNPRTIEGRRMLLFQKLYRRFYAAIEGFLNGYFIDWQHCEVPNWPAHIDKFDLTKWSDQDISLLEQMLENKELVFESDEKFWKDAPPLLGITENYDERPMIRVEPEQVEGEDCAISDDEMVCGSKSYLELLEEAEIIAEERAKGIAETKQTSASDKPAKLKTATKPLKYIESVEAETDADNIKVISNKPADEIEKQTVLAKALEIYRRATGKKDATEIDWSLMNVSVLQNHLKPFSAEFETDGDVKTLAKLIKKGRLFFNNLNTIKGRSVRVYERLYEKCRNDVGFNLDDFLIKWKEVDIFGWPEGVEKTQAKWKADVLSSLENLLNEDQIYFKLTAKNFAKLANSKINIDNVPSEDKSASENSPTPSDSSNLMHGLLSQYHLQTTGSLYENQINSNTPSFATAVLTPTNNKKRTQETLLEEGSSRDSYDLTEEESKNQFKRIKIVKTAVINDEKVKIGKYAGSSKAEVEDFADSVNESIAQYTTERDNNNHCKRKKRIISEIIRALKLIVQHAKCQKVADIPVVSVEELNEFVSLCCDTLLAFDEYGFINEDVLRLFVTNSINLRARLSGAKGNLTKSIIKKTIIADMEMFEFLTLDSSEWNVDFLEGFLDDEALPIFKEPKSKK